MKIERCGSCGVCMEKILSGEFECPSGAFLVPMGSYLNAAIDKDTGIERMINQSYSNKLKRRNSMDTFARLESLVYDGMILARVMSGCWILMLAMIIKIIIFDRG